MSETEKHKSHPHTTRISQMKSRKGMRGRPPLQTSSDLRDLCGCKLERESPRKGAKLKVSNSSTLSIPSIF